MREAISAAADGETHPLESSVVESHIARCAACASFASAVTQLDRRWRVRPAERVPDLSGPIIAAATPKPVPEWPRYVLLWVALTDLVLAIPALAGDAKGTSIHAAHELGSWDVALAVGLLVAVLQPRRAAGLLPFALALAGAMAATAIIDIVSGRVPAAGESQHILDLIGVGALWLLTRSGPSNAPVLRRALRAA
ncbi:MAG TPA: zf-HC2 domain-containing protein [Acidimicrobiales bacterium]